MHQQYRSWLFSEEDLSPAQRKELQEHKGIAGAFAGV
jgi:hypothetical protein